MLNLFKPAAPERTIFFRVALRDRRSDLLLREIQLLRACVGRTLAERPVHVDAWVVMPRHMECIWTLPEGDRDFAARWRLIKGRFTRGLLKTEEGAAGPSGHGARGIGRRGIRAHTIQNAVDYELFMARCWTAPVREGLVARPEDWETSSFNKIRPAQAA
jgi:putative transposase